MFSNWWLLLWTEGEIYHIEIFGEGYREFYKTTEHCLFAISKYQMLDKCSRISNWLKNYGPNKEWNIILLLKTILLIYMSWHRKHTWYSHRIKGTYKIMYGMISFSEKNVISCICAQQMHLKHIYLNSNIV